ncbi:hypothetical protein BDN67DRAFT_910745 [Paxillus ammoniavirescens]|nr:hypothetical protein BDN67DRAFT_910745 [Paxillus ammoniavirescens]
MNHTITQMLQQCVAPHQRDWVLKLPAIEFTINSACSESTGYAPFFSELQTLTTFHDLEHSNVCTANEGCHSHSIQPNPNTSRSS